MDAKQYEILALTLRYWFVLLIVYIFWQSANRTIRDIVSKSSDDQRRTGNIPFILVLLSITAFGLLALNDPEGFNTRTAVIGLGVAALVLFQFYFMYFIFRGLDVILLLMVDTLSVLGFIMLYRLTPDLAVRQIYWFAAGSVILFISSIIIPRIRGVDRFVYPLMALGLVMEILVFFVGHENAGSVRWLHIGESTIQPSEFIKIILIVVLACYMRENRGFKRNIPVYIFTGTSILLSVIQRDLGSALHFFILFLLMHHIGTSNWLLSTAAMIAGTMGSILSYNLFSHVRVRVQAWKNPWSDVEGRGYQVVQSLIAIGSGGLLGLGLGMGEPYVIPASRTDFIFAAICEEFGILVGGLVIGFFVLILIRGMGKALEAHHPLDMQLACGSTISLAIQGFIIVGGVIKLIPLTGITLPFVSYGGSSMIASMAILGIMQGVSIKNRRLTQSSEEDEQE